MDLCSYTGYHSLSFANAAPTEPALHPFPSVSTSGLSTFTVPTVAAPFGGSVLVAAGAGDAAIRLMQIRSATNKDSKDEVIVARFPKLRLQLRLRRRFIFRRSHLPMGPNPQEANATSLLSSIRPHSAFLHCFEHICHVV
jgi:hypothetical protein